MSLFYGLTGSHKLAGIVGLSAYLLMGEKAKTLADAITEGSPNVDAPFFMGHGDRDPLVIPQWGRQSADQLVAWGRNVDFRMYKYVCCPCSISDAT